MSVRPCQILNVEPGEHRSWQRPPTSPVIDPDATWDGARREALASKSGNSGFLGATLTGRATDVYVGGYATLEDGAICE